MFVCIQCRGLGVYQQIFWIFLRFFCFPFSSFISLSTSTKRRTKKTSDSENVYLVSCRAVVGAAALCVCRYFDGALINALSVWIRANILRDGWQMRRHNKRTSATNRAARGTVKKQQQHQHLTNKKVMCETKASLFSNADDDYWNKNKRTTKRAHIKDANGREKTQVDLGKKNISGENYTGKLANRAQSGKRARWKKEAIKEQCQVLISTHSTLVIARARADDCRLSSQRERERDGASKTKSGSNKVPLKMEHACEQCLAFVCCVCALCLLACFLHLYSLIWVFSCGVAAATTFSPFTVSRATSIYRNELHIFATHIRHSAGHFLFALGLCVYVHDFRSEW